MKKQDDIYLTQIQQRIKLIRQHLRGITHSKFIKSDLHKAAVVRELEVIGEAAKMVSEETKQKFPQIPWNQIVGMRNRLIHEYFNVDDSIIWEVVNSQLPSLEKDIERVFLEVAPPSHPWRNCPLGYYYVHRHLREVPPSERNPDGKTSVRAHCRHNPSGRDQLYPDEVSLISEPTPSRIPIGLKIGKMTSPKAANDYDNLIVLWTQYWNDVFGPEEKLSPNVIKALFFSESSFNINVKDVRIGQRNFARGPLQITDATRKILADEKGELGDHFLTLDARDVKKVDVALAASIRWLFHKRELASKYLGRTASWDEAVADYKGYLRKKQDFRKQKGMQIFLSTLDNLNK